MLGLELLMLLAQIDELFFDRLEFSGCLRVSDGTDALGRTPDEGSNGTDGFANFGFGGLLGGLGPFILLALLLEFLDGVKREEAQVSEGLVFKEAFAVGLVAQERVESVCNGEG